MRDLSGVRVSAVVAVAVVSTVICLLLLRGWRAMGNELPEVPWIAVAPLALLILLVLVAGWQVRRYARFRRSSESSGDRAPQQISPQRARGTLVAAQASALGGGALVGWYLAIALIQLPNADVVTVRGMVIRAGVSAAVAVVLAVAGLVAQHWCRLPPGADDEDDEPPRGVSYVS